MMATLALIKIPFFFLQHNFYGLLKPASSVVLLDCLPRDPDAKPSEMLNQYDMFIAISNLQLTSLCSS